MKSTQLFSDRVDNYVKFRPSYPAAIIAFMRDELGLTPTNVVADIGSGTGISAEIFLRNGNPVYGVEPNDNMRAAAERFLQGYPSFKSQSGTSEQTHLPSTSVDLIVAAQAFHWFEPKATLQEFRRILRPGGWVALIWNARRVTGTAFAEDYEALILKFGTDYQQVTHKHANVGHIQAFLGQHRVKSFENHQDLDFEGLLGRLVSSSYIPNEGDPRYEGMRAELSDLFDRHQKGGSVRIEYDTEVFYATS